MRQSLPPRPQGLAEALAVDPLLPPEWAFGERVRRKLGPIDSSRSPPIRDWNLRT